MARRSLIIQQSRQQLLGSGSLPEASAGGVSAPDLGGIQRFASALLRKGKEDKARKDEIEGARLGNEYPIRNSDGTYQALPSFDGWSNEKQDAFRKSREMNLITTIEGDVLRQMEDIEAKPLSWQEKQTLMEGVAETRASMVEGELQPRIRAWAMGQAYQRGERLRREHLNTQDKLQIAGTKTRIEEQFAEANRIVESGGDPSEALDLMEMEVNTLVGLEAIDPDTAVQMMENAREGVAINAIGGQIGEGLFEGEYDPEELKRFAAGLIDNRDETMTRRYTEEVQGDSMTSKVKAPASKEISTKEVRARIKNPEAVKDLSARLLRAVTLREEQIRDSRQGLDYYQTLKLASERSYMSLPSHLRDDHNKHISQLLTQEGGLSNPQVRQQILAAVIAGKYAPSNFITALRGQIQSGNPEDIHAALDTWVWLRNQKAEDGRDIGAMVIDTIPEGDRDYFDIVSTLDTVFGRGSEAFNREFTTIREKLGNPDYSLAAVKERYNATLKAADSDERLEDQFIKAYQEHFGLPETALPAEQVRREFERSLQIAAMGGIQDTAAMFRQATERTFRHYEVAPYSRSGINRMGDLTLTNPPGYTATRSALGNYEWINDFLYTTLKEGFDAGKIAVPPGGEEAFREALDTNLFDGTGTFSLEPLPGSPNMPQYRVQFMDSLGNLTTLQVKNKDGSIEDLVLDPGPVRRQTEARFELNKEIEGVKAGDIVAQQQLRGDIWRRFLKTNSDPAYEAMGLPATEDEFLEQFNFMPEDLRSEYGNRANALKNSLKEQLEKIDKKMNDLDDAPASSNIDLSSLELPGAKGYDLTAAAVSYVQSILPESSGGEFLMNVAAQESNYGTAKGTFRANGDMGLMQINSGSSGAFAEVKRQIAIKDSKIARAAAKLEEGLGINLAKATKDDLAKPLVNVAFARLYMMTMPEARKGDLEQQARLWKAYYNTVAGKGTEAQFLSRARSDHVLTGAKYRGDVAKYDPKEMRKFLTMDKGDSHLAFRPQFGSKLQTLLVAAQKAGHDVKIYSGYRSPDRQAELWREALKKYGSPERARQHVAPPGRSQHNHGNAADLLYGSDKARQWVVKNAPLYGLHFRMQHNRNYSNRESHIEDIEMVHGHDA